MCTACYGYDCVIVIFYMLIYCSTFSYILLFKITPSVWEYQKIVVVVVDLINNLYSKYLCYQ